LPQILSVKSAKPLKIPHKATPAASVRVQGNALSSLTNTAGDILNYIKLF